MDTIKNYLENMFLNMPCTSEVLKAKQELSQMMEDKYNELKAEGKSENEAIGIVISEFGNLKELASELGIDDTAYKQDETNEEYIPLGRVQDYVEENRLASIKIAIGVLLCICSPIGSIVADTLDNEYSVAAGVFLLFAFVAIAVGLFIYATVRLGTYKDLRENKVLFDFETERYLKEQQESSRPFYALFITVGVILCIVSLIPMSMAGIISSNDSGMLITLTAAAFFLLIGIGVMLIIMGSMQHTIYGKLLKNKQKEEREKLSSAGENIMSVYWPTVVCIYLIWSFLTFSWEISWIIWPVAGVLHRLLKILFKKEA